MVDGKYGLEHPDAATGGAARQLWSFFGAEPECREDLDRLYPQVTQLLDSTEQYIQLASSLHGLVFLHQKVTAAIDAHPEAQVLRQQSSLIEDLTSAWGLRCEWAPFSLLHTLSNAHCGKNFTTKGIVRIQTDWADPDPCTQPIFTSGLLNPNVDGYVGDIVFDGQGNHQFSQANDNLTPSLANHGSPGYTVPVGATEKEGERLHLAWQNQNQAIKQYLGSMGMVEPKEQRKVTPSQVIAWLYYDLRHPYESWAKKATRFEAEYGDQLPGVSFKPDAIAQHVNRSREKLGITRLPDRLEQFG